MKNGFVSVSVMGDMYVNVNHIQYLDIEVDSSDIIHVFAYFIGREKVCICSTVDMEDAVSFIEHLLKKGVSRPRDIQDMMELYERKSSCKT